MPDAKKMFEVGGRYKLKEPYYLAMILVVKTIDRVGVVFEDELENYGNRLDMKTKHCFGWPPLQAYLDKNKFRKVE